MDLAAEWAYIELADFEYQANPWNKGDLTHGLDFDQRLALSPEGRAVRVGWKWPTDAVDIMSYPSFIWGMKPWSTTSTTPLLPARIDDIDSLTVDFDLAWAGQPRGNFNVSFDLWIADATTEASSNQLSEVMVWIKNWDWETDDKPVATYADANGTAKIYHRANHIVDKESWNYAAVVFEEDVGRGELDVLDLLDRLAELGIVDSGHLLMDIELGAEIVNGSGWLDVRQLTMSYDGQSAPLVTDETISALAAVSE